MPYMTLPRFYTGALLSASALNTLSDDIAWLQAFRARNSKAIPLWVALNTGTTECTYMFVHRFDTLAIGYTIAGEVADATPDFVYNHNKTTAENTNAHIVGGGDFSKAEGTHTYTVDLTGLTAAPAVGQRYTMTILWDPGAESRFELNYLYEVDA